MLENLKNFLFPKPDPKFTVRTVKLKEIDQIPYSLEEGVKYILTKWNTNIHIEATGEHTFKIIGEYGEPLKTNTEYILIRPTY